ncbi:hypothetical protein [Alteromonas sp. C1M14]|uniref:hypothetical protein n=1 Tax=Alteromonas sp. C1M14 TaxID=2841567 RepID=UPI001C098562|nr:hypothetical protein [Alteromonas sp. C1M14]MBU2978999.1 hypothetical protein [Alteromonas sp. C1M14]
MSAYVFELSDVSIANGSDILYINNTDSVFGAIPGSMVWVDGYRPRFVDSVDTTANTVKLTANWDGLAVNNAPATIVPLPTTSAQLSAIDAINTLIDATDDVIESHDNFISGQASSLLYRMNSANDVRAIDSGLNKKLVSINGFSSAGIGHDLFYLDESDLASLDDDFTTLVTADGERYKSLNSIANDVVTVGTSGNFSTINDAVAALSRKQRTHTVSGNEPYRATIRLLSGFVMTEQLFVDAINLSWITIEAEDSEVVIDRASLVKSYPTLDYASTPAFLAINNGELPIIGALFKMNSTGSTDYNKQHGVMVAWGGKARVKPYCGVKNATGRGLYGVNGWAYARNSIFSGAGKYGCRPSNSSVFNVRGSDFSGAGDTAMYCAMSLVAALACNLSGAGVDAVQTLYGSYIVLSDANLTNAGRYGVWARGGLIEGYNIDVSGFGSRGVQAEGGALKSDGFICDNPGGVVINAVLGGEVTLTNAEFTNVAVNTTVGAYSGGIVRCPGISITGPNAGNQQYSVLNGGTIIAPLTSYIGSQTPNKQTEAGLIVSDGVVKNVGNAKVSAGTNIVTVDHGLSFTPDRGHIQVTPNNQEASTNPWWVANVNSTSFSIGVYAPGGVASDASFNWSADIS